MTLALSTAKESTQCVALVSRDFASVKKQTHLLPAAASGSLAPIQQLTCGRSPA